MENDESITLSPETLAILDEFFKEKTQRERLEFEKIQNKAGKEIEFAENWQLSQFWYSEKTKHILGTVAQRLLEINVNYENYQIALLSCPSLYKTIKNIHDKVNIFEYDKRFGAFGDDFVYYDFNEADTKDYLNHFHQQYDLIIADPPFLSEECIKKVCKIIQNLLKFSGKIIFCSGALVENWLCGELPLKKCSYQPEHKRNLGNEFACYANFDLDSYVEKIF